MLRLLLLSLVSLLSSGDSFASFFLEEEMCERPLRAGEVIMNNIAELSTDRKVQVFRVDSSGLQVELENGSEYVPDEAVYVALSDVSGEFVFETNFGKFTRGGCAGRRSSLGGKMKIAARAEIVEIVAGWASSHSVVSISAPFVLVPPKGGAAPAIKHHKKEEALSVNLPMEKAQPQHDAAGARRSRKYYVGSQLRGALDSGRVSFDELWKDYVVSQGFLEKYYTDKIINILLVVSVILCIYSFYRVLFQSSGKQFLKSN